MRATKYKMQPKISQHTLWVKDQQKENYNERSKAQNLSDFGEDSGRYPANDHVIDHAMCPIAI
jgi:hypothetical protein